MSVFAIFSRTARQLLSGFYSPGAIRKVLLGPIRGTRFVVKDGMGLGYALGRDTHNFKFLRQKIRLGDVIYDIGANRGQLALFFSKFVGESGRVVCFEPFTELSSTFLHNLELNHISNVLFFPIAVSSHEGFETFHFSTAQSTCGTMLGTGYPPPELQIIERSVQSRRLDAIVEETALIPTILKIDVEGAASEVLAGSAATIERFKPCIYIELHSMQEQRAVASQLIERGYRAETMKGEHVVDPCAAWYSPLWCRPV